MKGRGKTGRAVWLLAPILLLLLAGVLRAETVRSPHGGAGAPTICLDCHNAHYAPYGPLLQTINDDRNCYSCHADTKGPVFDRTTYEASRHYRQSEPQPESKPKEDSAKGQDALIRVPGLWIPLRREQLRLEMAERAEEAARQARDDKKKAGQESQDEPEIESAQLEGQVDKTCVKCHNPHGRPTAGAEKLLRGGTPQSSNGACANCHPIAGKARTFLSLDVYQRASAHASPTSGVKWEGSSYARGECVNCHDPHGTSDPKMLRDAGLATCYRCHVKTETGKSLWPGESAFKRSAHAAICTDCHNPHGAVDSKTNKPNPKLLTKGVGGRFCLACHEEIAVQYSVYNKWAAVMPTSRHPADTPGGKIRCVDCHNPHVIRKKDKGGYEPTLSDPDKVNKAYYWYQGNSSGEFCLKCHDGSWAGAPDITLEMKDRQVLVSGFARASDRVSLHNLHLTQYHKQKCSSCHQPHATAGPGGINRGKLLYNMTILEFNGGYQGFSSCETGCHTRRCASCHPLPK